MSHLTRRSLTAVALAATALLVAACVPDTPPATTTTTTAGPSTVKTVDDAVLDWTISREADNGTFAPGQVNYWSAGVSDGTEATYVATDGNATVLKKNASGTYVPIGSESAVSWANKNKDGNGNTVNASNAFYLGQQIRYTDGTGTVDSATGEATIEWSGTFTINFYGVYVPFQIADPTLTVEADGSAQLTATASGIAKDMGDPEAPGTPLPETEVVLADFSDFYATGSIATGVSAAATDYLGTAVTVTGSASPQVAQTPANEAYWGSWPQSFVDFQIDTNLSSYWYTSGLATTDSKKPQEPISVSYTLNP